jgi:S-adenosylmethionine:tRNA ribosyltransferase-isomerase
MLMTMTTYTLSDFDFELPDDLIAQTALPDRTASRLLHVEPEGQLHDRVFADVTGLLQPVICWCLITPVF